MAAIAMRRQGLNKLVIIFVISLIFISTIKAEVLELTPDTFTDKVNEKDTAWFVKFCVPWCKHCKSLGTLWEDLGKEMEGADEIEIGQVDCGTAKTVCSKVDIHSYPTFKLFYNGEEVIRYQGYYLLLPELVFVLILSFGVWCYAKRSPQNQTLIGSAGSLVRAEDFMAIIDGGKDEEGDLEAEKEVAPSSPSSSVVKEAVRKNEGLIVFFPGIPGCAKSALCKEILSSSVGLEDDRPVHSLMGDLVKGKYWQKVAEQRRKKPYSIMLADKNAPNEEVWRQIESMCRSTKASAVPVVPDSEGTETNPFSLDALAIFTFRVLNHVNHPGNLDKASPNACYVLLVFYHLYDGKNRQEFEAELIERFGSLVMMPLLKPDRRPLPESIKSTLEEGINLYRLHSNRHGRLDSTKGTYAHEWTKWEKQLRDTLFVKAEYLNSIQVPFESTVKQVLQQLRSIAKGDYTAPTTTPTTEKRKLGNIVFAAVNLPVMEIKSLLHNLGEKNSNVDAFFKDKNIDISLKKAHLTLAHKKSHGVIAVANYGSVHRQNVPVEMTALFFSDKLVALEGHPGSSSDGEKVTSKNVWPHVTLWTDEGIAAKEANNLPQLFSEGKATKIEINPPITVTGTVEFY